MNLNVPHCVLVPKEEKKIARNAEKNHSGIVFVFNKTTNLRLSRDSSCQSTTILPLSLLIDMIMHKRISHLELVWYKTCKLKIWTGRANTRLSHTSMPQTARCRKNCVISILNKRARVRARAHRFNATECTVKNYHRITDFIIADANRSGQQFFHHFFNTIFSLN